MFPTFSMSSSQCLFLFFFFVEVRHTYRHTFTSSNRNYKFLVLCRPLNIFLQLRRKNALANKCVGLLIILTVRSADIMTYGVNFWSRKSLPLGVQWHGSDFVVRVISRDRLRRHSPIPVYGGLIIDWTGATINLGSCLTPRTVKCSWERAAQQFDEIDVLEFLGFSW